MDLKSSYPNMTWLHFQGDYLSEETFNRMSECLSFPFLTSKNIEGGMGEKLIFMSKNNNFYYLYCYF